MTKLRFCSIIKEIERRNETYNNCFHIGNSIQKIKGIEREVNKRMEYILTRTRLYPEEKPLEDNRVKRKTIIDDLGREREEWTIKINSLQELNNFIEQIAFSENYNGEIVMGYYHLNNKYKFIEIYDNYRE